MWLLKPVFSGGLNRLKAIDDGPRDYDRYGFRIPAVIVSPYARPDYVHSETLDHTSVLKLIEEKWNLPPLTRRDAAASSPLSSALRNAAQTAGSPGMTSASEPFLSFLTLPSSESTSADSG